MNIDELCGSGRKPNQRMKHFLVLQYLLRETDEEHPVSAENIAEYLKETHGIFAERRSIYKDIKEINFACVMSEYECSYEEATEMLESNKDLETVRYQHKKGYYVARRPIQVKDARLFSECIYTARFISQDKAKNMIKELGRFLSSAQKSDIKHDMMTVDRIKVNNEHVFENVDKIKKAMLNKSPSPQKITFKYSMYELQNSRPIIKDRRKGSNYKASPYAIIINEGNYYLLALVDGAKKNPLRTFRIDRMHDISFTAESREKLKDIEDFDNYLSTYTQRVFSMYSGDPKNVEIRFVSNLLGTIVDRFGTKNALYSKIDEKHYQISVKVEVSNMFFGWITGLGKQVKLLSPPSVVDQYKKYLEGIISKYEKSAE